MKKLLFAGLLLITAAVSVACGDNGEDNGNDNNDNGRPDDAKTEMLQFPHLDGYGNEVMRDMPILFEYEMRDYVKYQVAFVSCTCRAPRVNYWSVAYFEISKSTGEILTLTFSSDGDGGDYTAGMWADSDPIPDTGKTYEGHFKVDFIPWLIGKNSDDLDGINIFYNDAPSQYTDFANSKTIDEEDLIDAYAGSSVTTHSIIRVSKTLLDYHDENYMD